MEINMEHDRLTKHEANTTSETNAIKSVSFRERPDYEEASSHTLAFHAYSQKKERAFPIYVSYQQGSKPTQQDSYFFGRIHSLSSSSDLKNRLRRAFSKAHQHLEHCRSGATLSAVMMHASEEKVELVAANLGDSPILLALVDSNGVVVLKNLYEEHNATNPQEVAKFGADIIKGRYCPEAAVKAGQSQGCEVTGALGDCLYPDMRHKPDNYCRIVLVREKDKHSQAIQWSLNSDHGHQTFSQAYLIVSTDGILPYKQKSVTEQLENLIKPIFQKYSTQAFLKKTTDHEDIVSLASEISDNIRELHTLEKQNPTGTMKGDNLALLICPLETIQGTFAMGVADGHGNRGQSVAYEAVRQFSHHLGLPEHDKQFTSQYGYISQMKSDRPLMPAISTTTTTTTTTTLSLANQPEIIKTSPRGNLPISLNSLQKMKTSWTNFFKHKPDDISIVRSDNFPFPKAEAQKELEKEKKEIEITHDDLLMPSSHKMPSSVPPSPRKHEVMDKYLNNARNIHALQGNFSVVVSCHDDVKDVVEAFHQKLHENYPNEPSREVPNFELRFKDYGNSNDAVRVILFADYALSFGGSVPDYGVKAIVAAIQIAYNQGELRQNKVQEKDNVSNQTEEGITKRSPF